MLAHRIIPTILVKGRLMYKGKGFKAADRSIGHALQAIRIHQARGVDEICLLDIAATYEGRGPDVKLIDELGHVLFAPLAVGGGIKNVEDARAVLRAGADKVVLCTAAACDPSVVQQIAGEFGSQAVVVSIDVRDGRICSDNGTRKWHFGPAERARAMEQNGAGEILLQDVVRDGTLNGYNLDLIREVSDVVNIPVIASGGCKDPADMLAAIHAGASACAAGALFQFTETTPKDCAQYLHANGIEVRL